MENKDRNRVSAAAAKGFFVSMLVKDITLKDAIGDLIDNAVDAIKSRVATNPNDLSAFNVEVKLDSNSFSIKDNGCGMDVKIARETAFNFGKPKEHKQIEHSIGQFGIGMKRAFFKIGRNINVKSTTSTSFFEIDIDVNKWLEESDDWSFKFNNDSLDESATNDQSTTGFEIEIGDISNDAKISFSNDTFIDELIKEIQYEHMINLNKGLTISINDVKLNTTIINLVYDDIIKPTYWAKEIDGLNIKVIAGISTKDDDEGGWYIFCNDRLIIAKNKTSETVWTGGRGDGVPLWHAQYHRFRGYVFFNAKDSSRLPWNTTKTGMDLDSPIYKTVRSKMITLTRQVMELLDKLKSEKEKDNPGFSQNLNKAVEKSMACVVPVTEVLSKSSDLTEKFIFPAKEYNPVRSNTVSISYKVSKDIYAKVKTNINVASAKEVGEATFNYYVENEL